MLASLAWGVMDEDEDVITKKAYEQRFQGSTSSVPFIKFGYSK